MVPAFVTHKVERTSMRRFHALHVAGFAAAVLLPVAAAPAALGTSSPALATSPPVVVSVVEQGALRSAPAVVFGRDVAASTRLAGKVHWVFGDTLYARTSGQPEHPADDWRSATHATSWSWNPWSLRDVADTSTGVPAQLLPYTAEELAYNRAGGDPGNRYALWPSSIVATTREQAQILYTKVLIQPGELNYRTVGVGIADLAAGVDTATRDLSGEPSGLLFHDGDPSFGGSGAFLDKDGQTLYLYDCWIRATFDYPCRLARVSARAADGTLDWDRTKTRANYEAAVRRPDGTVNWTTDLAQATEVVNGSTTGWSVTWNRGLGRYLAVYNVPLSDHIQLRTAPRPEGPWSDPIDVFTGQPPSCPPGTELCMDYAAQQHPELATHTSWGTTIYVTYARNRYTPETPFAMDVNATKVVLSRS